jgi:hypothetical protein
VALYDEVPQDLRRDFYVIDREFYVHLDLDSRGETLNAGFAVKGSGSDHKVDAAIRRFDSLKRYCRSPQDI